MCCEKINKIIKYLKMHETVALPTDSIFGLSCLINKKAIEKLIKIKNRDSNKGLIITSFDFRHFLPFINANYLTQNTLQKLYFPNLEPITWIVPSKKNYTWLTGNRNSIAVRTTGSSLIRKVTYLLDQAIITTSANPQNLHPAQNIQEIENYFGNKVRYIYKKKVTMTNHSSKIIDIISGQMIR